MPEPHACLVIAVGNVSADHRDAVEHMKRLCPGGTWLEVTDPAGLSAALATRTPRLVLAGADGEWALAQVARLLPGCPVVFMALAADFGQARRLLLAGGADVILPGESERLERWFRQPDPVASPPADSPGEVTERLRRLLDTIPDFVCYKDGGGRWLETNAFGLDIFRLEPGSYRGRTDRELGEAQPEFAAIHESCIASDEAAWELGAPSRGQESVPHPDGRLHHFDVVKVPQFNPDGSRRGLLIIGRDSTDRIEAEQALRLSEARYREFFEHDLAADYVSTPEGQLLDCNPAFVRMFGFADREEALACNTAGLYPDPVTRRLFLQQVETQGKVEYHETELVRRDGQKLYAIVNALGTFDGEGRLVRMLGFLFDITKHKQLQHQFHQAQKMESIGRLAGGVAHDFNNLLTVINGHAELLLGQFREEDPVHEPLEQISRAGERAARLTRQLLAFSRRQVMQMSPMDLNRVVGEVHHMLERLIGADIRLETRLDNALPAVMADPAQLEMVLLNLAVNARDAMPGGGTLTITTGRVQVDEEYCRNRPPMQPGSWCRLEMIDTGGGMDPDTLARAFEPFFTTKAKGKGTGLGLATVYGIVKQVGGFVWLDSLEGEGTRVSIFLKPLPDGQAPSVETLRDSSRMQAMGSETVLLVEDEDMVRTLAARILARQGYRVLEAVDGQDALRVIRSGETIHLVISDIVMPRMGGRELARELRRQYPDLPVMFMSGHADPDVEPQDRLQAIPLLPKPFERDELLRRVRELIEARR